jgi:hypothetical protein
MLQAILAFTRPVVGLTLKKLRLEERVPANRWTESDDRANYDVVAVL